MGNPDSTVDDDVKINWNEWKQVLGTRFYSLGTLTDLKLPKGGKYIARNIIIYQKGEGGGQV